MARERFLAMEVRHHEVIEEIRQDRQRRGRDSLRELNRELRPGQNSYEPAREELVTNLLVFPTKRD